MPVALSTAAAPERHAATVAARWGAWGRARGGQGTPWGRGGARGVPRRPWAGVPRAPRRDSGGGGADRDRCPPRQPRGPQGRARAPGPRRAEPGRPGAARPGEARPPSAGRQRDHPDSAAGAGERPAVAMAKPAVRLEFVERGVFAVLAL